MVIYIWIIFLLAVPIGILATIVYFSRRKVFQARQWVIALVSGIAWGIGGLVGAVIFGEAWQTFFDRVYNGYGLDGVIYDELGVSTYYRLALAGVLAGVLGCTALYFLLRKRPSPQKLNTP
jgi:uncharacterized membrane protein YfcA